jgi:hypothetical protein
VKAAARREGNSQNPGGTVGSPHKVPNPRVLRAARRTAGSTEDAFLAPILVRMWALASDRSLPREVPPGELTAEELIIFRADDFSAASGRDAIYRPPTTESQQQ